MNKTICTESMNNVLFSEKDSERIKFHFLCIIHNNISFYVFSSDTIECPRTEAGGPYVHYTLFMRLRNDQQSPNN